MKREIGLFPATILMVANMIDTWIFTTSGMRPLSFRVRDVDEIERFLKLSIKLKKKKRL